MNNDRQNLQKQREDLEKEEEELLTEVMKLRSYFAGVASYQENQTKAIKIDIKTSRSYKTELYQPMTEPSRLAATASVKCTKIYTVAPHTWDA